MIREETVYNVAYDLCKKAAFNLPADLRSAFPVIYGKETDQAKKTYDQFFSLLSKSESLGSIICIDTGNVTFYTKIGGKCELDPNVDFDKIMRRATEQATKDGILRATVVDPFTRENPDTNVGEHSPILKFKPEPGANYLEMTVALLGGGGVHNSSFSIQIVADGVKGIKKFVLDTAVKAATFGKACPPNLIGVGVGGSSSVCMELAEEAAVLRPVGNRHREKKIADLELELLNAINATGIGHMGFGGNVTAVDVHVDYALTHAAFTTVAVYTQCLMLRRATARIYDGKIEERQFPSWC
jgi:tartrate/fumarate subfamily iron-sulfur-dependent hydro-lyase alpha chain